MQTIHQTSRFLILFIPITSILPGVAQDRKTEKGMDQMWGETKLSGDISSEDRSALFDESNFGMFIHWRLNSHLGGEWEGKTHNGIREWIMNERMSNIPIEAYRAIADDFNPVNFDANAIAKLAKDVGMKYINITSKHNDGFAMFHSKADSFNIVDATPFGRDPMKELVDACRSLDYSFNIRNEQI